MFSKPKVKLTSYYILYTCVVLLGIRVLLISLQENTVMMNDTSELTPAMATLKQGWSFFSKNPQEDMLLVHKLEKDKIEEVNLRNFQTKNMFGIQKDNRVVGYILQSKLDEVPDSMIIDFRGKLDPIIINGLLEKDSLKHINLHNFEYLEKGDYLIQLIKKTPWSWHATLEKEVYMPSKIILFKNK